MAKRGRKRKIVSEEKVFEWEKDRILPENLRDEMETMWELPQIYHFLQLTKEAFNITHLSMYEVERMLLMPKASKQLAHIMTCLLSSPSSTKSKLHSRIPPMPYEFWTNILSYKLRSWYKMYQAKHEDPVKVLEVLGVEPEFWIIFPDSTKIEGKDFQDFSFKQRVWLLKTVCDTAMHSRKTIQDEMTKQPWESQFEMVLGIDRYGARYIYFPQFLHSDLRVYKHSLDNKVLSTVKPKVELNLEDTIEPKEEPKVVPRVMSKKKRRKSRWSNGSLPQQKKREKRRTERLALDHNTNDSNSNSVDAHFNRSSRSSSKASEQSSSSLTKSSGYETNVSGDTVDNKASNGKDSSTTEIVSELMENLKSQIEEAVSSCEKLAEDKIIEDSLDETTKVLPKTEDSLGKENSLTVDDLSKSSKTDDEKLEEISSLNASKSTDKIGDTSLNLLSGLGKDVNISKSDDEKLSESKRCDTSVESESLNDEISQDKWIDLKKKDENANESYSNSENDEASDSALSNSTARRSARIKHISEIKLELEDGDSMLEVTETEKLSSIELRDSLCRVSSPESDLDSTNRTFDEDAWKVNDLHQLIGDLSVSNFQLVADSLDSLKELTEQIVSDANVPPHEIKTENYQRPSCEKKLIKRMKSLCISLQKVESILVDSAKKARNKLQREWHNFENGVADEDREGAEAEDGGSNRWLMGSQAWPQQQLLLSSPDRATALPHPTLSPTGPPEPCAEEVPGAAPADSPQTAAPEKASNGSDDKAAPGSTEGHAAGSPSPKKIVPKQEPVEDHEEETLASRRSSRKATKKEKERKQNSSEDESEEEPAKTTRVLRARGISSYTEQLFSDEESEEDKLDGWADIEAIYAPAGSQVGSSTPNTPTKARDSCYDDSEEEDSDQDWILPSSRKRKGKRPSASRRLKSFQYKLQNIKVDQTDDQSPSQVTDTKAQAGQIVNVNPRYQSTRSRAKSHPQYNNASVVSRSRRVPRIAAATASSGVPPLVPLNSIKSEPQDPSLHSVLDIKDEGPIYDSSSNANQVQQNYVVVTSGHAPVPNYYVMQQNPPVTAVMQQSQFIQPTTFVSQVVPQTVSGDGYYVQQNPSSNYIVQNPAGLIATTGPRPTFIASNAQQVVYQQQQQQQQVVTTAAGYVQYVAAPLQSGSQPRIINTTTLTPPRQIAYRMRTPTSVQNNRMPIPPRAPFPHTNGAVIRSAPLAPGVLRPGQRLHLKGQKSSQPRLIAPRQPQPPPKKLAPKIKQVQGAANTSKSKPTTTSLIVLSDSDDEIQMIASPKNKAASAQPKQQVQPQKEVQTQSVQQQQLNRPSIPAELVQRMSEGCISLSPIRPAAQPAAASSNTQIIVVVNDTGSHYALALPNGSKLILTPEQVAQIRASNGGKLVL